MATVQRNGPGPCGSGLTPKKRCLGRDGVPE